jgi:hypothetical protein
VSVGLVGTGGGGGGSSSGAFLAQAASVRAVARAKVLRTFLFILVSFFAR